MMAAQQVEMAVVAPDKQKLDTHVLELQALAQLLILVEMVQLEVQKVEMTETLIIVMADHPHV